MDEEPNLLVILNDNRMSISEAVGGLTKMLGRMTGSATFNRIREGGKKLLGDKNKPPARFVKRWEEHWKGMFVPSTLFEEMGFHYTGPIDGHDLPTLLGALRTLKTLKGPQLLHVITTKGKGYELAEGDQIGYHAVGPFDPAKGLVAKPGAKKPTVDPGAGAVDGRDAVRAAEGGGRTDGLRPLRAGGGRAAAWRPGPGGQRRRCANPVISAAHTMEAA